MASFNYVSALQEISAKLGHPSPLYHTLQANEGWACSAPCRVMVQCNSFSSSKASCYVSGPVPSKQEAKQAAAAAALAGELTMQPPREFTKEYLAPQNPTSNDPIEKAWGVTAPASLCRPFEVSCEDKIRVYVHTLRIEFSCRASRCSQEHKLAALVEAAKPKSLCIVTGTPVSGPIPVVAPDCSIHVSLGELVETEWTPDLLNRACAFQAALCGTLEHRPVTEMETSMHGEGRKYLVLPAAEEAGRTTVDWGKIEKCISEMTAQDKETETLYDLWKRMGPAFASEVVGKVLCTPYNGVRYHARRLCGDVTPASTFEKNDDFGPGASNVSFADYFANKGHPLPADDCFFEGEVLKTALPSKAGVELHRSPAMGRNGKMGIIPLLPLSLTTVSELPAAVFAIPLVCSTLERSLRVRDAINELRHLCEADGPIEGNVWERMLLLAAPALCQRQAIRGQWSGDSIVREGTCMVGHSLWGYCKRLISQKEDVPADDDESETASDEVELESRFVELRLHTKTAISTLCKARFRFPGTTGPGHVRSTHTPISLGPDDIIERVFPGRFSVGNAVVSILGAAAISLPAKAALSLARAFLPTLPIPATAGLGSDVPLQTSPNSADVALGKLALQLVLTHRTLANAPEQGAGSLRFVDAAMTTSMLALLSSRWGASAAPYDDREARVEKALLQWHASTEARRECDGFDDEDNSLSGDDSQAGDWDWTDDDKSGAAAVLATIGNAASRSDPWAAFAICDDQFAPLLARLSTIFTTLRAKGLAVPSVVVSPAGPDTPSWKCELQCDGETVSIGEAASSREAVLVSARLWAAQIGTVAEKTASVQQPWTCENRAANLAELLCSQKQCCTLAGELQHLRSQLLLCRESRLREAATRARDQRKQDNENKKRERIDKLLEAKDLGNAAYKAGKFAEAVDIYGEATKMPGAWSFNNPVAVSLSVNRTKALFKCGRFPEMLKQSEAALRLTPRDHVQANFWNAKANRLTGNLDQAERVLRSVLEEQASALDAVLVKELQAELALIGKEQERVAKNNAGTMAKMFWGAQKQDAEPSEESK